MTAAFLQHSILKPSGCRLRSFSSLGSASAGCPWSEKCLSSNMHPISFGSLSHVLGSYEFKHYQNPIPKTPTLIRSVSTSTVKTGGIILDTIRNQFSERTAFNRFSSIQFSDAEPITLWSQILRFRCVYLSLILKPLGLVQSQNGLLSLEFEIFHWGNSCLYKNITNSYIHHITNDMENLPDVPRMEDFIPVLMNFIANRTKPRDVVLLVAHNARNFDVRFLIEELKRCLVAFPCGWKVLDSLPMVGRQSLSKNGN